MTWFGWIWDTRRSRWERVCEAEGLSACSRRLGEIVKARGKKEKYATMTGGAVPAFRPAGRHAEPTLPLARDERSDAEASRPSSRYLEGF